MNGLEPRQYEDRSAAKGDYAWPSVADALQLLFLRWKTFAIGMAAVLVVTMVALRIFPKSYESVAVVTTRGAGVQNPAERDNNKFKVLEREKLALDELRSSLFSYDIVKKAAEESGIVLNGNLSTLDHVKRSVWSLVGGEISTDPVARERVAMDILRFNHFTFEKLDARTVQDRLVEHDTNMFLVGMQYRDPQIARMFLQRVLELYRDKLSTDQTVANEKLAKIYDELASSFGKNIESMQGNPKVARQKLQGMDVLKEQLKAKLSEEALVRNTSEQEISLLRKDVIDAEARYSDKHPVVETLRRKFAEGSARAKFPIGRIQNEISSIRAQLSSSFSDLLEVSQGTFETSGISTEGHSEQFTKDRKELRSMSNVFETMKERYLQIVVQERISNMASGNALEIMEAASLPLRPKNPSMTKVLLLGLVAGIMAGIVAVFVREILHPIVRNRWVLSLRTGLPVFAEQQLLIAESMVLFGGLESRSSLRHPSNFRRNLKRLTARSKMQKPMGKERRDDGVSLGLLLTKLASIPRSQENIFQCGLMPFSTETPSVGVAYSIAKQLAQAAAGRSNVVIIATEKRGGILELLEGKSAQHSERLVITESGIAIYDATDMALNSLLPAELSAMGYQCIVWDLPSHESLAWRSLEMPKMPIIGVLEYGQVRYSEIEDAARWLKVMATENGFAAGLFVAGSASLPKVKLFEYFLEKVA
jgi:hypothetical protein